MHEGYLALMIPIVGIVVGVGFPCAALIAYFILDYRKRRRPLELHHAERMAAIERGMEVPPLPLDLLRGRPPSRRTGLLPGLICSLLGLAFLAVNISLRNDGFMFPGAVLLAIGVAFLIFYAVEGKKNAHRVVQQEVSGS